MTDHMKRKALPNTQSSESHALSSWCNVPCQLLKRSDCFSDISWHSIGKLSSLLPHCNLECKRFHCNLLCFKHCWSLWKMLLFCLNNILDGFSMCAYCPTTSTSPNYIAPTPKPCQTYDKAIFVSQSQEVSGFFLSLLVWLWYTLCSSWHFTFNLR